MFEKKLSFLFAYSVDNSEKIRVHHFFVVVVVVVFAAGHMGESCPGGDKAPNFFCIKHAKTVIFRVNIA